MHETISTVRQGARETTEQMKRKARAAQEQATIKAREYYNRAGEYGHDYLRRQQCRASDEIGHFSNAMRQAANKLHEENDHNVAHYAEVVADQIDNVRDYVGGCEPSEMIADVRNIARRHPEIFLGGLFLAGLGVARFLKASSQPRAPRRYYEPEEDFYEYEYDDYAPGFEGPYDSPEPAPVQQNFGSLGSRESIGSVGSSQGYLSTGGGQPGTAAGSGPGGMIGRERDLGPSATPPVSMPPQNRGEEEV